MQSISADVEGALVAIGEAVASVRTSVSEAAESIERQTTATLEVGSRVRRAADGVASTIRELDNWIIGVEERRQSERERVTLKARLHPKAGDPIACTVVNLSETGAKVMVAARSVPDRFDLDLKARDRRRGSLPGLIEPILLAGPETGTGRWAQLAWGLISAVANLPGSPRDQQLRRRLARRGRRWRIARRAHRGGRRG